MHSLNAGNISSEYHHIAPVMEALHRKVYLYDGRIICVMEITGTRHLESHE